MPGTFYKLKTPGFEPAPNQRVVKSQDYAECRHINELMSKINLALENARKSADEIYKKRYAEGFAEGEEAGKAEYEDKMLEMVLSSVESIEQLESQLVEVVIDSVTKIIGEFEPHDRVNRVVHQALNAVRGSKNITIRVCPEEEALARETLGSFLLSSDHSQGYVDLRMDPNLKVGDCVLETEMGVVDSGLQSQLRILKNALMSHMVSK